MKYIDQLSEALSNKSAAPSSMDNAGLSQLLAGIGSGKGNGAADYEKLLAAYAPPRQQQNMLSSLGDSMMKASVNNPQQGNIATFGLGLSGMHDQEKAEALAQQEQYRKAIADLSVMAGGQRDHEYKKKSDADKLSLETSQHDETIRNNIANNAVNQGQLSAANARLTMDRDNAADEKSSKAALLAETAKNNNRTETSKNIDYLMSQGMTKEQAIQIITAKENKDPRMGHVVKMYGDAKTGDVLGKGVDPTGIANDYNVLERSLLPPGAANTPTAVRTPPTSAVLKLKANPSLRDQFEAKYGAGSSSQYLGK